MKKIEKDAALDVLDEIDEFRRNHSGEPTDVTIRMIEAMIARRASYTSRSAWTDDLKARPTRYARDLADTEKIARF